MTHTETLTPEIKTLIKRNATSEDFRWLPGEFGENEHGNHDLLINWDKISDIHIRIVKENLVIITERTQKRQQQKGIVVGDYLRLPDGTESRVTYHWGHKVQDGGGRGSFYMTSNGGASYSGSLDDPKPVHQIKDTGETKKADFWIFSRNHSGANKGFGFTIPVKVWELINTEK